MKNEIGYLLPYVVMAEKASNFTFGDRPKNIGTERNKEVPYRQTEWMVEKKLQSPTKTRKKQIGNSQQVFCCGFILNTVLERWNSRDELWKHS